MNTISSPVGFSVRAGSSRVLRIHGYWVRGGGIRSPVPRRSITQPTICITIT